MGTVVFKLEGDEADAVRAFLKVEDKQKSLEQRAESLARKTDQHNRRAIDLTSNWTREIVSLGAGYLTVSSAVGAMSSAVQNWDTHMKTLADSIRAAGREMVAFAAMQEPGTEGATAQAAAKMAARYGATGVTQGQVWNMVQAFQARPGGTFQSGMAATRSALDLSMMANVPIEGARAAVATGMGLNLSPEQAAQLAYAAGKASQLSPAEMAQMAGVGLPAFMGVQGGPVTGYGVAAALSGLKVEPGELGTYTKQIGGLLQQTTGGVGKTWKKLGFAEPGGDPVAQLKALQKAGLTTSGKLQQAGFAEKESQGLVILLQNLDQTIRTMQAVAQVYEQGPTFQGDYARAAGALPAIQYAEDIGKIEGDIEFYRTQGPTAPAAMQRDLARAQRARLMEKYGNVLTPDDKRAGAVRGYAGVYAGGREYATEYFEGTVTRILDGILGLGGAVERNTDAQMRSTEHVSRTAGVE